MLRPCGRRLGEQLKNGKKAHVAGAWRVRGAWRGGHWLDCKGGLVGHGKDLDFTPRSNGEATEGFYIGEEAGDECMPRFTHENIALALDWRTDEGG